MKQGELFAPAERALCDFIADWRSSPSCDRPICVEHTRRVGYICARPHSKSDTIDYCREHPH